MPQALRSFVAIVSAAGIALVGAVVLRAPGDLFVRVDALLVLFAVAILVAELFPLDIPGHEGQATFSTTFAFALLLAEGTAVVILTHVVCVVLADLLRRRSIEKLVFNAAQYALSWKGRARSTTCASTSGSSSRAPSSWWRSCRSSSSSLPTTSR